MNSNFEKSVLFREPETNEYFTEYALEPDKIDTDNPFVLAVKTMYDNVLLFEHQIAGNLMLAKDSLVRFLNSDFDSVLRMNDLLFEEVNKSGSDESLCFNETIAFYRAVDFIITELGGIEHYLAPDLLLLQRMEIEGNGCLDIVTYYFYDYMTGEAFEVMVSCDYTCFAYESGDDIIAEAKSLKEAVSHFDENCIKSIIDNLMTT